MYIEYANVARRSLPWRTYLHYRVFFFLELKKTRKRFIGNSHEAFEEFFYFFLSYMLVRTTCIIVRDDTVRGTTNGELAILTVVE